MGDLPTFIGLSAGNLLRFYGSWSDEQMDNNHSYPGRLFTTGRPFNRGLSTSVDTVHNTAVDRNSSISKISLVGTLVISNPKPAMTIHLAVMRCQPEHLFSVASQWASY